MKKTFFFILLLSFPILLHAKQYGDSAIFQGVLVKLDLLTPAIEAGVSRGKIQDYEVAVSVRLKNRFYPTIEGGTAFGTKEAEGGKYKGQGGFMRIGMDFNGLRKNITSPHALFMGVRIGTAYQDYDLTNVVIHTPFWGQETTMDFEKQTRWDVWGEVLAGCNVNVASNFYMGWCVRLKILFTRKDKAYGALPYYVPGYGFRDANNWGFNYYIGWRF